MRSGGGTIEPVPRAAARVVANRRALKRLAQLSSKESLAMRIAPIARLAALVLAGFASAALWRRRCFQSAPRSRRSSSARSRTG